MNKLKFIILGVLFLSSLFGSSIYAFKGIKTAQDALNKEAGIIYLVGENHNNKADIKQKELLRKLATQGEIVLALEGLDSNLNETLFGLEETNTNHISASLTSLMDLFRHILYKKMVDTSGSVIIDGELISKGEYSEMFNTPKYQLNGHLKIISSYLKTAILEKRNSDEIVFFQSQAKTNKLVGILLKFQLGLDPSIMNHIGKNSFDDNFYDNMSNDNEDWYFLLRRIASYWQQESIASSIISDQMQVKLVDAIANIDSLYAAIKTSDSLFELKEIMNRLSDISDGVLNDFRMDLRNEIFLNKICAAYESTKDSDKGFYIVVGARHTSFLKEELLKKGYRVEVNDEANEYLRKDL